MKREKSIWYYHQNPDRWQPEYPECSFFEHLRLGAVHYPDLVAVEFQGRKYTYKQLISNVEMVATALIAAGVKKEDIQSKQFATKKATKSFLPTL